MTKYLLIFKYH